MNAIKFSSTLLGLCLVLALAFFGVASPARAAPLVSAGLDTGANVIVIRAQDVNAGQVFVDSVTAAQDGWLLIRKDKKGAPGDVIGFVPVQRGATTNLRADIQSTDIFGNDNVTPTLWATLVADPYALAPFASPGPAIKQVASLAVVAFASRTAVSPSRPAVAAGAYQIVVRAQDVNASQLVVDSVTAAQDGWLLIRKDDDGAPGDMIGFVPVHQGTTTGMRVDIQLTDMVGDDNITPALWATLVPDPNALTPFVVPDYVLLHAPSAAAVAFSSSAASAVPSRPPAAVSLSSPSSGANAITTHAQDTANGRVVIDSVSAAQAGWVLIRKNAGGLPGEVLGFAPVHPGVTVNVTVVIRTSNAKGDDIVTPALWAMLVADPTALDPFATPDAAIRQQAGLARVAFSSR